MTTTISHPKTKELSGTIEALENGQFETTVFGGKDWHDTHEEAKADILTQLEYEYSGQRGRDNANDRAYSNSEQWDRGF